MCKANYCNSPGECPDFDQAHPGFYDCWNADADGNCSLDADEPEDSFFNNRFESAEGATLRASYVLLEIFVNLAVYGSVTLIILYMMWGP